MVGLNTGCGERWRTRLWPERHWAALARRLRRDGCRVLLLGGETERASNRRLARRSGATNSGVHPLPEFIEILDRCDLVVTTVTMGLHLALALDKKVVLFNNLFNPAEFELYGLGEILEPPVPCRGCYRMQCGKPCLELITPTRVAATVRRLLARG